MIFKNNVDIVQKIQQMRETDRQTRQTGTQRLRQIEREKENDGELIWQTDSAASTDQYKSFE